MTASGDQIRPASLIDADQVDCALVALATRRAAPFYQALGYEESAVYLRQVLQNGS